MLVATDFIRQPNCPLRKMNREICQLKVVGGYTNTAPFLGEVRDAADANRNALGFYPKSVFEEFARRDRLYVLAEITPEGDRYAGHLLFEARFPRAHVLQMFILPQYRRGGLATKLINHLRSVLTNDGYISIYARVAEDLVEANGFWDRQQFYVQRVDRGGSSRNRQILVRCHELASPQLFPSSGINAHNPLGIAGPTSNIVPLFLLDLNVLFDLSPRRLRHDEAASLFQADRMNLCRLAISNEIREELRRNAQQGRTDPMESYIGIFPAFPLAQDKDCKPLLDELAALIFPGKRVTAQLSVNDLSDLRHVATAIQHDLAGLVTSDGALLNAAPKIKAAYGVDVVSPEAFCLDVPVLRTSGRFETTQQSTLHLSEVSAQDESAVHALLTRREISGSEIATGWLPSESQRRIATRFAVWNGATVIGYSTWSSSDPSGTITARVAIDETTSQSLNAARILLIHLLEHLVHNGPRKIRLELPSHQSLVREVATGFGFHGTPDQRWLTKLFLGKILTKETWSTCQAELSEKFGLRLPTRAPEYRGVDQRIQVLTPDGNQTHLSLDELESLLSPTLFCLPGRQAVITPVRRGFSESLIGHSPQGTLLPLGTAALFNNRHYISDSRTLRHFKRGTLILFYESMRDHGCAAIIAIARVRQAYLKSAEALEVSDFEQSVLTTKSLPSIGTSAMKTITVFDNIFRLPRPVPLASLKRIGCGRPNNLITTNPVSDEQLKEILREAFNG
jgi:GNAT superfamily N-acetyltransferase